MTNMKTLLALSMLVLQPTVAKAAPYFRLIDLAHPKVVGGAFVNVEDSGDSSLGTAVALVTHSVKDGCAVPSFVCMDWVPLSAGFSHNGGKTLLGLGTSVNLAPIFKATLLKGLVAVTGKGSYKGLKSSLGSVPIKGPDVTVSFGPTLLVSPTERWKGYFRMFCGAAWQF